MSLRKPPARLAAFAFLLIALCAVAIGLLVPDWDAKAADAPSNATISLSSRLDTARIQSPLLGLAAASSIAELSEPLTDLLLDEGFDDFDWELEDWRQVSWARVVEEEQDGEQGSVLRLDGFSRGAAIGWVLPVRSDSFYLFERALRVLGEPFCDFNVVESVLEPEAARPDSETNFLAGRGSALKVHSLGIRSDEQLGESWQRSSLSFHPTPRTRSLVVLLRPRVGFDPGTTLRSMSFDDVRLTEVLPSSLDRMRLLKASHAARDANPELGMRKSGLQQPMSIPGPGQVELQRVTSDLYDGAVSYVDHCIGGFLDALRERGLYERATIAFVADHGEQLWEHGNFGHGGAALFDEIVRVPLIVKPAAGSYQAGLVITTEVSGFDVMPTLLELAGIEPIEKLDALSLVALMSGAEQTLDRPSVTETSARGLALVDAGFKFVLEPGGQSESLYDLREDRAETTDVALARPEELLRMRALCMAYLLEHRPGRYLLVHGSAEPVQLQLSTRSVRTLVGPSLELEQSADAMGTEVRLAANAWGLLEIEDADTEELVIQGLPTRGSDRGFGVWIAGALPQLKGAGVWRLRGPEKRTPEGRSSTAQDAQSVDQETLDALRRLGYVE